MNCSQRSIHVRWISFLSVLLIAATAVADDTVSSEWSHARDEDLTGLGACWSNVEGELPGGDIISLDQPQPEAGIWDKLSLGGAAQKNRVARPWDAAPEETAGAPLLSLNQSSEEYGSLSLQSGAGDDPMMNINHSFESDSWIKSYAAGVQSDRFSTLLTVGATMSLAETEAGIIASRLQAGYGLRHGGIDDTFQGTADLFMSRPIMDGQHWIKGGWFIDQQSHFGKTGPTLSFLLNAQHAHPLTIDLAYGFGYGQKTETDGITQVAAADADLQTRVGTYIGRYQVGATGQYLRWDNGFADESWEGGGFVGIPFENGNVLLDFTMGESGPRGMANVVLFTGAPRTRATIRRVQGDGQLPIVPIQASGNSGSDNVPTGFVYGATKRATQIRTAEKQMVVAAVALPPVVNFLVNNRIVGGGPESAALQIGGVNTQYTRNIATNANAASGTFIIVHTTVLSSGPAIIQPDGINKTDGNGFTFQTALAGSTVNGTSVAGARLYPVP